MIQHWIQKYDLFAQKYSHICFQGTSSAPSEVSNTAVTESSVVCVNQISTKRNLETINKEHIEETTSVDHDYISKKARMAHATKSPDAAPANTRDIAPNSKVNPNEKYRYRRTKNNIASKRSRETRKMKYVEMEDEATRLVKENESLRERMGVLEQLAKEMKATLVEKLSSAHN